MIITQKCQDVYGNVIYNNITESESLKSRIKITGKTADDVNIKNVEIIVLLKYLNNIWRII